MGIYSIVNVFVEIDAELFSTDKRIVLKKTQSAHEY